MIELLLQAEGALSVGLLDRAETLYRQVATADPRNSIAVVGLARVALERSDEVAALTLARRALLIDPENDAARRMVRRLEEVLRHRGVTVAPADAGDVAAAGRITVAETPVPAGAETAVPAGAETAVLAGAEMAVPAGAEPSPEPGRRRRSYLARLLHRER